MVDAVICLHLFNDIDFSRTACTIVRGIHLCVKWEKEREKHCTFVLIHILLSFFMLLIWWYALNLNLPFRSLFWFPWIHQIFFLQTHWWYTHFVYWKQFVFMYTFCLHVVVCYSRASDVWLFVYIYIYISNYALWSTLVSFSLYTHIPLDFCQHCW